MSQEFSDLPLEHMKELSSAEGLFKTNPSDASPMKSHCDSLQTLPKNYLSDKTELPFLFPLPVGRSIW